MGKREQERCQSARDLLASSKVRLADLETRGIEAMSKYDIEIAHSGNAQQTLDTALWLKRNHIAYATRELETCNEPVTQQTLFDAHMESDYDERNGDIGDY